MQTADQLSRLLGPLRRAVLRRTRESADLPDLADAQIELLRTLPATSVVGVRETAERLRVSSSTVSNLVRTMTARGLVERRNSEVDLRAVELAATPLALKHLKRYDEVSRRTLQQAMNKLSPEEQSTLAEAVPVLAKLLAILEP